MDFEAKQRAARKISEKSGKLEKSSWGPPVSLTARPSLTSGRQRPPLHLSCAAHASSRCRSCAPHSVHVCHETSGVSPHRVSATSTPSPAVTPSLLSLPFPPVAISLWNATVEHLPDHPQSTILDEELRPKTLKLPTSSFLPSLPRAAPIRALPQINSSKAAALHRPNSLPSEEPNCFVDAVRLTRARRHRQPSPGLPLRRCPPSQGSPCPSAAVGGSQVDSSRRRCSQTAAEAAVPRHPPPRRCRPTSSHLRVPMKLISETQLVLVHRIVADTSPKFESGRSSPPAPFH